MGEGIFRSKRHRVCTLARLREGEAVRVLWPVQHPIFEGGREERALRGEDLFSFGCGVAAPGIVVKYKLDARRVQAAGSAEKSRLHGAFRCFSRVTAAVV